MNWKVSAMNIYCVKREGKRLPCLDRVVFDPANEEFCIENSFVPIDCFPWYADYPFSCESRAYVTWSDEGLQVLLCSYEEQIEVQEEKFNGEVYKDSCLEFFLQPFLEDTRFLNIEINANGVALIGIGADRDHRTLLETLPEGMNISASKHKGGWWAISYIIPDRLLYKHYRRHISQGQEMRANFYKCERRIHPHYGMWCAAIAPKPDFYQKDTFGILRIE